MLFRSMLLVVAIAPIYGGFPVEIMKQSVLLQELMDSGKLYSAELVARRVLDEERLTPGHPSVAVAVAYQRLASILLDEADLFESIGSSFLGVAQQQRIEAMVLMKRSSSWSPADNMHTAPAAIQRALDHFADRTWMHTAARKLGLAQYARGAFRHFNGIAAASGAAAVQKRRLSPKAAAAAHAAFQDAALRASFARELNMSAADAFFPSPPMLESQYAFHVADALFQFGFKQRAAELLCNASTISLRPASFDGRPSLAALHPDLVLQASTLLRVCGVVLLRGHGSQAATPDLSAIAVRNYLGWLDHPWGLPVMAAYGAAAAVGYATTSRANLTAVPQHWTQLSSLKGDHPSTVHAMPFDALAEGVLMKRLLHCYNTSDVQRLAQAAHPLCKHANLHYTSLAYSMKQLVDADMAAPVQGGGELLRSAALALAALSHPQHGHWDSTGTSNAPQELMWLVNQAPQGHSDEWRVAPGSHVACAEEMLLPIPHRPLRYDVNAAAEERMQFLVRSMMEAAEGGLGGGVCPEAAAAMAQRAPAALEVKAGDILVAHPEVMVQGVACAGNPCTSVRWQQYAVNAAAAEQGRPGTSMTRAADSSGASDSGVGAADAQIRDPQGVSGDEVQHAAAAFLQQRALCTHPSGAQVQSHGCIAAVPWTDVAQGSGTTGATGESDTDPSILHSPAQVDAVLLAAMGPH